VTWPRKPSRPLVRALALAVLTLVLAGFSVGAAAAVTTVPTGTTSASQLAEALRKYRQQSSTKTAAPVAGANGATPGGANTPTTTFAPSGGATAAGGGAAATTPTTATPTPAATTPAAQATAPSKATSSSGDQPLSTGAIVIAVLAALLVLGCLIWAFARSRAFEPPWLIGLRHAAAEAGFRASATWSELLDWARLGR
jgi:cobalamin biosynthesis Mg chelatase CobN